ncbi:FAD-binding and (Fe-S)-binding domain-containing protein [Streptomyces iconiensis]|uniref:FAD-linked oxidase C-terminal domain-containing protein n=1 Tax=Streptomyces iconiensis TaxID=1384038 RepID=A0ABT6ZT08_9ACTN|nr:FAD-binding and (Fe-S)-binding domain-containing protein [Streptomyces iconiensis]MDJ1132196.1 FAD-linked oxidase C-terminal domain-containing protein [Streptomyces iconiensis]
MAEAPHDRTREIPAKTDPRAGGPPRARQVLAVGKLAQALRDSVEGEVRFDPGARAMYAHDASNFRQVPIGVVTPRTVEDVVTVHRLCHEYGAPILNRGGGTSLSGETVNYAVVIDHSRHLTRIGEIEPEQRRITCEPGVINEQLNRHTGRWNLIFGPDPSTHSRCAIGGNVGNNSCGIHSVQAQLYGPGPRTSDNVEALEIVTYGGDRFWVGVNEEDSLEEIIAAGGAKGEIYARLRDLRDRYADAIRAGFPSVARMPRRVSGFNLDELLPENGFNVARSLVGTESTCATVLRAQVLLTPALLERSLVVVEYEEIADAAEHVADIVERFRPIGLEALDEELIEDQWRQEMNLSHISELPRPEGGAWLLVQFGADTGEDAAEQARAFAAWLTGTKGYDADRVTVADGSSGGLAQDLWAIREAGLGSTAFPPSGDQWPGWEDSAVPPGQLGDYIRRLSALMDTHGLRGAMYGHFAQGCIHSRISFDLHSAEGIARYRRFLEEAADLVSSYGGSLSGEHGDGQQRGELLERQYGPELLRAMREFKLIWDPEAKMNPGKVIDAYPLDEDLRLGPASAPAHPRTVFAYPQDGGDFTHATLRCVGVGQCRNPEPEQTMCPSYQVTREEKHTTRGRARLLYEMLRGETVTDGWQSREVAESLDLCLACKGCTSDCPVDVDIPTYKAEFLHHHYKSLRRWRPRHAYAFGFIDQGARLASRFPEAANLLTHAPGLSHVAKLVAGIDRRRPLPAFAPMTLQRWFRERGGSANPGGPPVVLFPDTFTNHFHTEAGVACVEALEAAGRRVILPEQHVCCGRPLYDYGFLGAAERYLHAVVDVLRPHLHAGTPVVGMEPSCTAVFKDELTKLLPHDDDARRLAGSTYHFAEFFRAFELTPPTLPGTASASTSSRRPGIPEKALLWGHCHQRATGGTDGERWLLEKMGLETEELTGGCCGLAGSWGFENGKYGISMDCGEQGLLPGVRAAGPETAVVANGFSCRTQLADAGANTGQPALHIAQLMSLARGDQTHAPREKPTPAPGRRAARLAVQALGGATVTALGATLTARAARAVAARVRA